MRDTFYFAVPVLTAVMLASCVEQAYQDGVGLAPKDTSSSSTGEPPGIPTTSSAGDPGVHTATGPEVAESSTSTGPTSASDSTGVGGNAAPKIEGFSASPKHLDEAGPIKLELVASDDVEVVKVHLELDGEKLAELTLELTGSSGRLVQRPLPKDDPVRRQPDITLARKHLGWEPKVQLRQGLPKTLAYFDALLAAEGQARLGSE